jgi:ABC-type nickel/cobalt efflux system permease component RcnA
MLQTRAKAIAAAITAVAVVITDALADNVFEASEVGQVVSALIVAGAGVYAVWRIPNRSTDK